MMRSVVTLSLSALLSLMASTSHALGLPLIISATVDPTHSTVTINGQNFGSNPSVTLDALAFPTQSSATGQIVASFPVGRAPASFTPGTYLLTLTFKNQLPAIFAVDIGGSGAQGPVGPAGAPGATGTQGAPGPVGPAGVQGVPGPIGPVGATGATGAAGIAGAQGLQGVAGASGAPGAKGDKGDPGSGGGLVCTAPPNLYLSTASNGVQSCQARYFDNGDGTVTDNQTGLMWERQTSTCGGEVTCFNVNYTWSTTGSTLADGSLFTSLIAGLNGGDYFNPSAGRNVNTGVGTCLANHCDWRIPTLAELKTIVDSTASGCGTGSPCIDSAFGPTLALPYRTTSSVASIGDPVFLYIDFSSGVVFTSAASLGHARATRTGR